MTDANLSRVHRISGGIIGGSHDGYDNNYDGGESEIHRVETGSFMSQQTSTVIRRVNDNQSVSSRMSADTDT
jgi:molybdopterin biosynthesis enzyme